MNGYKGDCKQREERMVTKKVLCQERCGAECMEGVGKLKGTHLPCFPAQVPRQAPLSIIGTQGGWGRGAEDNLPACTACRTQALWKTGWLESEGETFAWQALQGRENRYHFSKFYLYSAQFTSQ